MYTKLNKEKEVLYNFIANTLLDRILVKKLILTNEPVILIASQRETNRFLNLNFKNYLETEVKRNHKVPLTVEIKTPYQEKGLQAADFLIWAIFRRFELGDTTYYDSVKKIIEESSLYPL